MNIAVAHERLASMIADGSQVDFAGKADSIYFLMFAGWKNELRSNRWHYATRWARHVPVILVQPDLDSDDQPSLSEPEPRIANCRVLHVRRTEPPAVTLVGRMVQARQIMADMSEHGHRRPILWTYSPDYILANAAIPAAARVYHATENYFAFEDLRPSFLNRLKSVIATSDLVIAVSDGVAEAYRPHARGQVEVATNGCDYRHYAGAGADPELAAARAGWNKLAVYAGNVNKRIDFELLQNCAAGCPQTLFALVGPVAGLARADTAQWQSLLLRPNVRHFGPVGVERLPAIYAAADVGVIPYRADALVVDNTFPLKAFEMQAAGLPVVSTVMKAIAPLCGPGLRVVAGVDEFVGAVRATSRALLSAADRAAIDAASRAQDYDLKFQQVLGRVSEVIACHSAVRAPGAELVGMQDDPDAWRATLDEALGQLLSPRQRLKNEVRAQIVLRLLPYRDLAHRLVPAPLRRKLRSLWPS